MIPRVTFLMEIEVYFLITVSVTVSLKITRFEVPSLLVPGDSAYLTCLYDLGKEKLYSVKWYKDTVEFYRFFPSLSPQYMAFPSQGITVDLTRSSPSTVYLRNVTLQTKGRYTCQVSADEPYFGCVQVHRDIAVYIPPENSPKITGISEHGENLTVQCTSAKSKPAANLSWYVNDILMTPALTSSHEIIRHSDQLESSSASLSIPFSSSHLSDEGNIKLACAASISNLVTSVSKEVLIYRHNNQSIRNEAASANERCKTTLSMTLLLVINNIAIFKKIRTLCNET